MADQKKQRSLFALLFSDLMMGAMGVIVVLLIFLKVVSIRGTAEHEAVAQVDLPPGMRDKSAEPLVRLRLYHCGGMGTADAIQISWDNNVHYSSTSLNQCHYNLWIFDSGLSGKSIDIIEKKVLPRGTDVHITLTVGGYYQYLSVSGGTMSDQIIAGVSLQDQRILYER